MTTQHIDESSLPLRKVWMHSPPVPSCVRLNLFLSLIVECNSFSRPPEKEGDSSFVRHQLIVVFLLSRQSQLQSISITSSHLTAVPRDIKATTSASEGDLSVAEKPSRIFTGSTMISASEGDDIVIENEAISSEAEILARIRLTVFTIEFGNIVNKLTDGASAKLSRPNLPASKPHPTSVCEGDDISSSRPHPTSVREVEKGKEEMRWLASKKGNRAMTKQAKSPSEVAAASFCISVAMATANGNINGRIDSSNVGGNVGTNIGINGSNIGSSSAAAVSFLFAIVFIFAIVRYSQWPWRQMLIKRAQRNVSPVESFPKRLSVVTEQKQYRIYLSPHGSFQRSRLRQDLALRKNLHFVSCASLRRMYNIGTHLPSAWLNDEIYLYIPLHRNLQRNHTAS
jgi:hypothetical protein